MKQESLSKEWFIAKYKYQDGSTGYLRLGQEAINRKHHEVALAAIREYGGSTTYRRVLDIGCACGEFVSKVVRRLDVESAIGVDFVREGLMYGQECYPHVKFVESAFPSLPFQNQVADLVLAMEVLYYLSPEDLNKSVEEMSRVCADGGSVVVSINLGDGVRELSESVILGLFQGRFIHCGTIYEYALLQQLLHTSLGRVIRVSRRLGIPVIPQLALWVRDNMAIAKFNFAVARLLLREKGITKGVYVFRKQSRQFMNDDNGDESNVS